MSIYFRNKKVASVGFVADSELSSISTNPVQNKVIKTAIDGLQTAVNEKVADVKVGETSVVDANKIANIPLGGSNVMGVVSGDGTNGISISNGVASVVLASNINIDDKLNSYKPIVPSNLDYAVRSSLTDSSVSWNNEQQTSACKTIGAKLNKEANSDHIYLENYANALNNGKFNQLIENGNFESTSGWQISGGTFTVSNNVGKLVYAQDGCSLFNYNDLLVNGHKYLMIATLSTTDTTGEWYLKLCQGVQTLLNISSIPQTISYFATSITTRGEFGVFCVGGTVGSYLNISNFMCIDLTQLYGAGNEPITLIKFKEKYGLPYYPYQTAGNFEKITDKNGHQRFVEGDITIETITGVSSSYGKWSLSGSHLLMVVVITVENGTSFAGGTKICNINIPQWVLDKIYPVVGNSIEYKNFNGYASNYTSQVFYTHLEKASNMLFIKNDSTISATNSRTIRISYDLLIDNS